MGVLVAGLIFLSLCSIGVNLEQNDAIIQLREDFEISKSTDADYMLDQNGTNELFDSRIKALEEQIEKLKKDTKKLGSSYIYYNLGG